MRADPAVDKIYQIWSNGEFIGEARSYGRVTIHRITLEEYHTQHRLYRSWLDFNQGEIKELPNVSSIKIDRSLNSDVATCTVTMDNVSGVEVGEEPEYLGDIDNEGYFTFDHGVGEFSTRWSFIENEWRGWLQPDRILKTYQGYGVDWNETPDADPNLLVTGVWIIDKVAMDSKSKITLTCRDLGELLVDQYVYPKVTGQNKLIYETVRSVDRTKDQTGTTVIPPGTKLGGVTHSYNSDYYWNSSGGVSGHDGPDAFDASTSTYWLSIGNGGPDEVWSYEWIQANVNHQSVGGVKFLPWAGNYVVYVGVRIGGVWQGSNRVPYDPNSQPAAPNHADEMYVLKTSCGWEQWCSITLDKVYKNVEVVRLTFHHLADSNIGTYQYRAGVRQFEVYNGPIKGATQSTTVTVKYQEIIGTVTDYIQIVKDICCIAGFTQVLAVNPGIVADPDVTAMCGEAIGRAYGDFESAGTAPILEIPQGDINHKPLMDVIRYVQEVLGYIFFVDERGGVIFRSANLWQVGNYLTNDEFGRARTVGMVTIDESTTLVDWSVELSNENKRKWIVIGNVGDPPLNAEVTGKETIEEFPLNMARLSMWTDQNFASIDECVVMADLVKLRQWFQFRVGKATIIGNPMIQIDDQIRVFERRTGEGYIHYVQGISSSWDSKSGKWTMDLTTAWLGQQPTTLGGATWIFDIDDLEPQSQEYLFRTGRLGL